MLELVLGPGGAESERTEGLAPTAPAAIVLERADEILGTGLIVAEEVFGRRVPPMVSLDRESFLSLASAPFASVVGNAVVAAATETEARESAGRLGVELSRPEDLLAQLELKSSEKMALGLDRGFQNSVAEEMEEEAEKEREVCDEREQDNAYRLAMRIVARVAALQGATHLLPIESAHIDAVTYIGPGGLAFAERMAKAGAKVKVPTTLNSSSVDRRRWEELGIPQALGEPAERLGDAYVAMGCDENSFTCAPCGLGLRSLLR